MRREGLLRWSLFKTDVEAKVWAHRFAGDKLPGIRDALAAEELKARDDNMDVETAIELRR